MTGHDPRPRDLNAPQPGFWLAQFCKGGPHCPAAIIRLQTAREPGAPDNLMERSSFLAAFICGQPVSLADVWHRRGRAIDRAEYDRAIAEIAAAVRENRYDPRCQPFKPVDITSLPLPFEDEVNAQRKPNNIAGHRRQQQSGPSRRNPH